MFLKPDEHMIVMNSNAAAGASGLPWIDLTTPMLRRLREECGITVAHEYLYWNTIESGRGKYDWSLADSQVKRCIDAGMRIIIFSPISMPLQLDASWYCAHPNNTPFREVLSFWNLEAREYQQNFLRSLIQRYEGLDVTVAYTGLLGEYCLWNEPVYYDQAAKAHFRQTYGVDLPDHRSSTPIVSNPDVKEWLALGVVDHLVAMQEVLVGQDNEVWDTTQHGIGLQSEHNGVFARPRVLEAYQKRWPDATRWLAQYTYWAHGPGNAAIVDDLLELYDCKMAVESDYCRGLASDPGTSIYATWGGIHKRNPERWLAQMVCPLHPFGGEKTLEPWMMDAMKRAVDTWAARDKEAT